MPRLGFAALVALVALAAGLAVVLLVPRADRSRVPAEPAPPAPYRTPAGAKIVSTSAGLAAALARPQPRAIVLADGRYDHDGPFIDSTGHRVYAKHLGKAVLKAGFVLEGHTNGALLRGLAFDVFDPGKTFHGAIVNVHGDGRDNSLLDLTLDGHRKLSAGIFVRQADGLLVRRVVARRFRDYGVFADANEQSLRLARRALVEDVDSRDVSRPVPRSSRGVAEACVWIGVTATVRRIRTRDCAWEGLWVGTGTRDSVFEDLDIDRSGVGIYVEHFASDSLFRRAHIGPDVVRGATCEWDDPAWGGRPACNDNVFEDSTFDTKVIGVYLDAGTVHTTIRRSVFLRQRCGAIGNYKGAGNLWDTGGNDYRAIGRGAVAVWTSHLADCP